MARNNKITQSLPFQIFLTLFGTFIYACGLYFFTVPNNIAPGGVSGLATIINFATGLPIGILTFVGNVPLVILGFIYLGRKFILKTAISVVSFTVFMDYLLPLLPQFTEDTLLSAIFGGMLIGLGVGFAFLGESSTGGLDISNKIIQMKNPHLKIGTVTFISDLVVIGIGAIVFGDITTAMYAIIAMFVASRAIDAILYGFDVGKLIIIVTTKASEITAEINEKMHRGVTKLNSAGGFTDNPNNTLLCAIRQNEYAKLKRIVHSTDPSAFMIVSPTTEVVGDGFKDINKT